MVLVCLNKIFLNFWRCAFDQYVAKFIQVLLSSLLQVLNLTRTLKLITVTPVRDSTEALRSSSPTTAMRELPPSAGWGAKECILKCRNGMKCNMKWPGIAIAQLGRLKFDEHSQNGNPWSRSPMDSSQKESGRVDGCLACSASFTWLRPEMNGIFCRSYAFRTWAFWAQKTEWNRHWNRLNTIKHRQISEAHVVFPSWLSWQGGKCRGPSVRPATLMS